MSQRTLPTRNERQIRNISLGQTLKTGWDINTVQSQITLSFDDASRTLTVTPSTTVYYFIKNKRYTFAAADTVQIDDTEGLWFIYFNGSTLTASQTHWEIQLGDVCMVSLINWDATNNKGFVGWECHGFDMSPSTHERMHDCDGARYDAEDAGLVISDGVSAGQVVVTEGDIWDEDIEINIVSGTGGGLFEQDLADPAKIPVLWRDGANGNWRKLTATSFPYYDNATVDNVYYNQFTGGAWQRTELGGGKYVNYWAYATHNIAEPIISIMGQTVHNTQALAEDEVLSELDLGTLHTPEMKVLYKLTIAAAGTIASYQDFRTVGTPGGVYVAPPTQVSDEAYGATWNGVTILAPSKNAVYDKVEALALTDLSGGNWKVVYTNGSGEVIELSLGADGTFLMSNGSSSAPTFEVPDPYPRKLSFRGANGFAEFFNSTNGWGWSVIHNDGSADIFFRGVVPKTSAALKISIVHGSNIADRTDQGLIYVAAYTPDTDPRSTNDKIDGDALNLVNTEAYTGIAYTTSSATFSADKGDVVQGYWHKSNAAGTENLYIFQVILEE